MFDYEYQHHLKKCASNPSSFQEFEPELKKNKNFLKKCLEVNPFILIHFSPEMKEDRELVVLALGQEPQIFQYLDPKFCDDKEIVRQVVTRHGQAIKYASERLKDDLELGLVALSDDSEAFSSLSSRLQQNKKIILKALDQDLSALTKIPQQLYFEDRDIALQAALLHEDYLAYFSPNLKNDVLQACALQKAFKTTNEGGLSVCSPLARSIVRSRISPLLFHEVPAQEKVESTLSALVDNLPRTAQSQLKQEKSKRRSIKFT